MRFEPRLLPGVYQIPRLDRMSAVVDQTHVALLGLAAVALVFSLESFRVLLSQSARQLSYAADDFLVDPARQRSNTSATAAKPSSAT
jgi:hypothetical protein